MPELALDRYRLEPTDKNFVLISNIYSPWLKSVSTKEAVRHKKFVHADVDDLQNEGLLEICRSTRRYSHVCRHCERAFLHRGDLARHGVVEHGIRGLTSMVSLPTFAECSAQYRIRKCVRAYQCTEELDPMIYDLAERVEHIDTFLEELILRAGERLDAYGRELLMEVLVDDRIRFGQRDRGILEKLL